MSLRKQKVARVVAAWICMLAVALLYAPMAGAALIAHGMDCCAGGYCKIPAHHHNRKLAQEQHSAGITCDHENSGSGMTACSMSCCQDPPRPALMPVTFVLPAANFGPQPSEAIRAMQMAGAVEILRFVRPLSPPPRFTPSVL